MPQLDAKSLEKFVEGLAVFFYVALLVAMITAIAGSPGWGMLMLILGGCALVGRTTTEAFVSRLG
jgi:hypothetical protein